MLEAKACISKMSNVMRKLVLPYANNKDVDQPVHPRSLISTFVVCCRDSMASLSFYIRNFKPPAQAGLSFNWSKTQKTGFLVTRLR